jgi:hypothetical protein
MTMTNKLWGLILGTALTQVACSAAPLATGESEPAEKLEARLVYTLHLNAAHKIDFYEYGLGITGTHETLPVGEVEALRLPDEQPRTLSELFKLVKPNAAVPEVLEHTDARVLAARQLTEDRLSFEPNFLTDLVQRGARDSAVHAESLEGVGKVSSAAITCSGDFFHDQWGASWYLQNFGTGFSDGVRCPPAPRNAASFSAQGSITNFTMSSARHPSSRILQWKQMEGDFTNAGSTNGFFVLPGATTGLSMWAHSIAPRTVSVHTLNPGNFGATEWFATGSSPCSHLHRTIVWCTAS